MENMDSHIASAGDAAPLSSPLIPTPALHLALLCAFCCIALSPARAALAPLIYQPNPVDLDDLDHHLVYTWRLDNINLNNVDVTSASLTFTNIANWDSNINVLHIHLLDTAINPGVASFVDDPTDSSPVTDLTDDFVSTRFHNSPGWLVAAGTKDTLLGNPSFTTTATTYTINFTASQLAALKDYIANGHDIAFGLDPDCHFFNDGITFTMNLAPLSVTPVPEVTPAVPAACLIISATMLEVRRRRRSARRNLA